MKPKKLVEIELEKTSDAEDGTEPMFVESGDDFICFSSEQSSDTRNDSELEEHDPKDQIRP